MSDSNPIPIALSHKQLNKLLNSAPKESLGKELTSEDQITQKHDFERLLSSWESISKQLLEDLRRKNDIYLTNKNPKSLMALGALESYLFLALQAKEQSE